MSSIYADLYVLERTGSTNTLALSGAKTGAAHGATWLADAQEQGRGRRQPDGPARQWHSPAGANIYMSVLLRPQLELERAAQLTGAVAAHIAPLLRELTEADIWVKWPNDLYIGARKLAGILTEAHFNGPNLEAIVVGVGLNVNLSADELPNELADQTTSLKLATGGRSWDRLGLCLMLRRAILGAHDQLANEGFADALKVLRQLDYSQGATVRFPHEAHTQQPQLQGTAAGIDDQGHLIVITEQGQRLHVSAGEVRFDLSTLKVKD